MFSAFHLLLVLVKRSFPAPFALAALLSLTACSPPAPPADPPLVADPPLGDAPNGAENGAIDTELERGTAYIKAEQYAEAKAHFEKAIAIRPTALGFAYLGVAQEKTGDRLGAEASYKHAIQIDPTLVDAVQNLAALYLDDPARPDEAIALLKPAIARAPDPRLLQNLAYALGLKGDIDGAGKVYQVALAKADDPQARLAWGSLLLDAKRFDEAAVQLKRALDGAPEDAGFLSSVGRLLLSAKAPGECVRALDRALKIAGPGAAAPAKPQKGGSPVRPSEIAEWLVRRGTCKHQLSDEPGARTDYELAIRTDDSFAPGHYYLGLSFKGGKDKLHASQELEKAIKLGGDGPIAKAAKEQLTAMRKEK